MKARHRAPTNKRCKFALVTSGRRVQCVRWAGHPADLYGRHGHRCAPVTSDEDWAFVCTRADLAGVS